MSLNNSKPLEMLWNTMHRKMDSWDFECAAVPDFFPGKQK